MPPTLTAPGDDGADGALLGEGGGLRAVLADEEDMTDVADGSVSFSLSTALALLGRGEEAISSGGVLMRGFSGMSVSEVGTDGAGVTLGTDVSMGEMGGRWPEVGETTWSIGAVLGGEEAAMSDGIGFDSSSVACGMEIGVAAEGGGEGDEIEVASAEVAKEADGSAGWL
jgi:hypothetical protein